MVLELILLIMLGTLIFLLIEDPFPLIQAHLLIVSLFLIGELTFLVMMIRPQTAPDDKLCIFW